MEKVVHVYYSFIDEENWNIFVAATSKGLCYVSTQIESQQEAKNALEKYMSDFTLEEDQELIQPYVNELVSYFEGERQVFGCTVDLHGTPFQQSVWRALAEIPYGETTTYSKIAQKIGRPKAVRAVGSAIGKNPLLIVIPCHRVIRKNGELSGFREGIHVKKKLLQLEKVLDKIN